jgi:uncharacterized protein (TIGR02145 family)
MMSTVKIGKQIWHTKNLSVDKFANGDLIFHAQKPKDWELANEKKMPAWCFYDDEEDTGVSYGRLYNWYAITDSRGIAPAGYKIPTKYDWQELIDALGGEIKAGQQLKGDELYWNFENEDATGFLALPGGVCNEGSCWDKGEWGCWWSITEYNEHEAYSFHLSNEFEEATHGIDNKNWALSVRCLKV